MAVIEITLWLLLKLHCTCIVPSVLLWLGKCYYSDDRATHYLTAHQLSILTHMTVAIAIYMLTTQPSILPLPELIVHS